MLLQTGMKIEIEGVLPESQKASKEPPVKDHPRQRRVVPRTGGYSPSRRPRSSIWSSTITDHPSIMVLSTFHQDNCASFHLKLSPQTCRTTALATLDSAMLPADAKLSPAFHPQRARRRCHSYHRALAVRSPPGSVPRDDPTASVETTIFKVMRSRPCGAHLSVIIVPSPRRSQGRVV